MTHICKKEVVVNGLTISKEQIISSIRNTNKYLNDISLYFEELELEIFHILGQRNISGLIGEVFSRFLEKDVASLRSNPHQDGRPDLLNIQSQKSKDYFRYSFLDDGEKYPIKSRFSPYPHGGIEVKCTIGDSRSVKKEVKAKLLSQKYGVDVFDVNIPRIDLFGGITYWAHHQDCSSLLGIYYDYYDKQKFNPQIISLFYTELEKSDWYDISVGNIDSKKTSNTSLRPSGKEKIKNGLVAIIDDERYSEVLKGRGYTF